jgi:NAD dependent epimerase/dehydratase family enzyme
LTFGEQLRILKIQKIAREQEEERQRLALQERLYLEKIQAVRKKQHVDAVINMEQMASESIMERFGI